MLQRLPSECHAPAPASAPRRSDEDVRQRRHICRPPALRRRHRYAQPGRGVAVMLSGDTAASEIIAKETKQSGVRARAAGVRQGVGRSGEW